MGIRSRPKSERDAAWDHFSKKKKDDLIEDAVDSLFEHERLLGKIGVARAEGIQAARDAVHKVIQSGEFTWREIVDAVDGLIEK